MTALVLHCPTCKAPITNHPATCQATDAQLRVALHATLDQLGGAPAPSLVIHYGVYPDRDGNRWVDEWSDATVEHHVNDRTIVSGSWGCWGPADQATDGDDSLHVLVNLYDGDYSEDLAQLAAVVEASLLIVRRVSVGDVHAWGTITTADHSETTHVWCTEHHGGVRVFPAGAGASSLDLIGDPA